MYISDKPGLDLIAPDRLGQLMFRCLRGGDWRVILGKIDRVLKVRANLYLLAIFLANANPACSPLLLIYFNNDQF